MSKITIYQANNPTFHVDKSQKEYSKENYHVVYTSTVTDFCGNPAIEHIVLLEMLFERFNLGNYPEDYKGYSLSVGDIVKVGNQAYICGIVGWKEINLI